MATHSLRTVATSASPCQEQPRAESAQTTDLAPTQPQHPLRTHDAWALPVDTLLNALGAEPFERELPDNVKAMLISHRGRLFVATLPGQSGKSKKHLIRLLLTEYIKNGWSAVTLDARLNVEFSESLEDETHPGEADKSEPPRCAAHTDHGCTQPLRRIRLRAVARLARRRGGDHSAA
ncbi:hypothetical protein [Streptomyces niveiscabiei]|uniref:Uncharacterized protein n=1 Tax=Streptomyces niveiscabiei TaxID=164115 RepID=A0ABW9I3E1_9ACTN